jgi:pullulanase
MTNLPIFDILERRKAKFTLWIPGQVAGSPAPQLLLGPASSTINITFTGPLQQSDQPDLWELDPKDIKPALQDEQIYHYWFEVTDTSEENLGLLTVTDPYVYTVDYSTVPDRNAEDAKVQPAGVIKYRDGKLWPCDIDGTEPLPVSIPSLDKLPENNHIVIYELPTSWSRPNDVGGVETDGGTFADVLALYDIATAGDRFKSIPAIRNEAVVSELGTNVLELLPVADAKPVDQWGYATSQYYAPDYDLGSATELVKLVEFIQARGMRWFADTVMAFGHDPYVNIAYKQLHINPNEEPNNPDSYQCNNEGPRNGWGGQSWRYIQNTTTYDPQTGTATTVHPSWAFHLGHLHRWMTSFGLGGLRLDSVNNIGNYDFLKAYKDYAWQLYHSRYTSPSDSKFLVIGEELSDPLSMITTNTLNALWNEPFKRRLRAIILGNGAEGDNFEWTVRKMVDCRQDSAHPFTDLAQAVIYLTSHDVGGSGNERLYNYLQINGITSTDDMQRRAKLGYACLLTAVGIPMIFAGEEFLDQQDSFPDDSKKQTDPVNYARKSDPWRTELFNYVANLVRFRQECPVLGDDDTQIIHVDGPIMAWTRGTTGNAPVVVVANFGGNDTQGSQYLVQNWPDQNIGGWREVTQDRDVPPEWVGKEPLYHWEVKIYTYWKGP